MKKTRNKIGIKLIAVALLLVLAVFVIGFFVYVSDYYKASSEVEAYFSSSNVNIKEIDSGLLLDGEGSDTALIFYPGAKVEYTAYIPMLYSLAENGVDVFLVDMPFNIAFFGIDKADDIIGEYNYNSWYIAGHSLGGAVAEMYAADHQSDDTLDGLVLLAAYPTEDISSSSLKVLTIYGSNDSVLSLDKVVDGRALLPDDATELVIEGGNHAQFGNYGEQEGDSAATVSRQEQQEQTVSAILEMIFQDEPDIAICPQ